MQFGGQLLVYLLVVIYYIIIGYVSSCSNQSIVGVCMAACCFHFVYVLVYSHFDTCSTHAACFDYNISVP
jgi:hypothetical protein